jgi:CubicO group peptidase (beta-lactamase class C family)
VSANEGNDYASDSRGEEICEYVDLAHRKIGFSGSVLVARDGEVIATASRGFADLEKKVPNSKQTLFEIASCTKPFTAIAVMKLAETGKLSLDDPITKHLPHVPENCRAITVRHLLAHTSGIPGTNIDGRGTDLAEVIPSFLEGGPKHPPGKHFEYWNQGYALLSEVVARVSGQTFNDFVRQEIFRPSSMDHSQFTGDTAIEGTIAAVGESIEGKSRSALEPPYGTGLQYSGMGGIVTNVEDLWNWDRAIANQTLISGVWLKKMTVRGLGGHGMGWTVRSGPDGNSVTDMMGSFVVSALRFGDILPTMASSLSWPIKMRSCRHFCSIQESNESCFAALISPKLQVAK